MSSGEVVLGEVGVGGENASFGVFGGVAAEAVLSLEAWVSVLGAWGDGGVVGDEIVNLEWVGGGGGGGWGCGLGVVGGGGVVGEEGDEFVFGGECAVDDGCVGVDGCGESSGKSKVFDGGGFSSGKEDWCIGVVERVGGSG